MKLWTLRAPLWTIFVVNAALFTVLTIGVRLLFGNDLVSAIGDAIVVGPLWSALPFWWTTDERRKFVAGLGRPMSDEELRAVQQAVRNGPVPDDPELRETARQLLDVRKVGPRTLALTVVSVSLLAGLAAALAVVGSPWWWPAVVPWAVVAPVLIARELRWHRDAARRLKAAQTC